MTAPALPAELESAVDWMVLLSSGSVAVADRVRFESWRQSDPRHAAATLPEDSSTIQSTADSSSAGNAGAVMAQAAKPRTA